MSNLVKVSQMAKWTHKQIEILKDNHNNYTYTQIGELIGKSEGAVIKKARMIGLKKEERWTKKQLKLLHENYSHFQASYLENIIGKSAQAIRKKAGRLKLKKSNGYRYKNLINQIPFRKYSGKNNFNSFISGFVAGEGTFLKTKSNKTTRFKFAIALADDDSEILEDIKKFFGVGNIGYYPPRNEKWKGTVCYAIGDIPNLIKVIIPFFDKFNFFTARKQNQYNLWKDGLMKHISKH